MAGSTGLDHSHQLDQEAVQFPHFSTRSPVNPRSVLLGLAGVCVICGCTAYNDYVLNNTYLVGTYLPIGLLMFFTAFIALVNAPLHRWAPRYAFGGGELAVALAMTLVSCALPSSGLMRYLVPHLVSPFHQAGQNWDHAALLRELDLPAWMFPTMQSSDIVQQASDPVVQHFIKRAPIDGEGFVDRWLVVPWSAWLTPAITWGLLLIAVYGAMLCLAVIVRRQWTENERLAFPLATIYSSLIEPPARGRAFNALMRSRAFWIATAIPVVVHGINGLHKYHPGIWPGITIHLDLREMFAGTKWAITDWGFQFSQIYFIVVGATYFMQRSIAFSLWFFFLLLQLTRMAAITVQREVSPGELIDQQLGSLIVMGLIITWLGRRHWAMVARRMFGRTGASEDGQRYLPYGLAGWMLVTCCCGIVAWLLCAGASLVGAMALVALMALFVVVCMRIAAETGLLFVQVRIPMNRPWVLALTELPAAIAPRTTMRSFYLTGVLGMVFTYDLRESLPVYATHAMRVADTAAFGDDDDEAPKSAPRRIRRGTMAFMLCLALALVVGYVVAGASMLYVEYSHAFTLDRSHATPINQYVVTDAVPKVTMNDTSDYRPPRQGPIERHDRGAHLTFGMGLTALLSGLRLRFVGFPLHPVGYLMAYAYPMRAFWFSIFVGWLLKVLISHAGGIELFRRARPFFIGLVIGEAAGVSVWMIVSAVLAAMGREHQLLRLLPV